MPMDPVTTKLLVSAGLQVAGSLFGRKKTKKRA